LFILWLFLGYLLLVVVLNTLLVHRVQRVTDFFQAGRRFGAWPIAISFVASWFGAASTIGQVQKLNAHGLSALWALVIPSILACLVIWRLLARRVAEQQALSLPQAIEQAYGRWARLGLAVTVLASSTAFIGSELIAAAGLFEQTLHVPKWLALLGFGGLVALYAAMAGFWTVVLTDFIHFVLFTAAIIIMAVWVSQNGSLATVWHAPPMAHYWQWLPVSVADWLEKLTLTLVFFLAWSIDPLMWQRMSAVHYPRQATQAAGQATGILVVLFALVTLIGLASPALVGTNHPAAFVAMAQGMPLYIVVLLGLLTALSSTVDSSLNIGSLTLTHDLVGFFRPGLSARTQVWLARLATGFMLLPASWIALTQSDIIKTLWISADIYVCALFFPLMGLLFGQPSLAQKRAGQAAMAVGGAFVLVNAAITAMGIVWLPWPTTTLVGFGLSGLSYAVFRYGKVQAKGP
jgi:solute:Na+ symporter, SSS family